MLKNFWSAIRIKNEFAIFSYHQNRIFILVRLTKNRIVCGTNFPLCSSKGYFNFGGITLTSPNTEEVYSEILIADDGIVISAPDNDEVWIAFKRQKNNKAPRPNFIPAELFKTGGMEFINRLFFFFNLLTTIKTQWFGIHFNK